MNQPQTSHRAADADRVAAISRLVRRVCLLREQGELSEAKEVESTRLVELIHAFRESSGAAAFTDHDLAGLYEVERKRVADANALCDVLVPFLQVAKATPPQEVTGVREPATPPRVSVSSPRVTAEGTPGITDMLDAMLAAERTSRRVTQPSRPKT